MVILHGAESTQPVPGGPPGGGRLSAGRWDGPRGGDTGSPACPWRLRFIKVCRRTRTSHEELSTGSAGLPWAVPRACPSCPGASGRSTATRRPVGFG